MIQWNELSFEQQKKILGLIEDLLLRQTDIELQDGLVAAMVELEMWSNSPCPVLDVDSEGPYISYVADPFPEAK